ncbi:MAG: hypothetical protein KIT87_10115 [Anaerolineae bacterium]|nr:hypothetical protein [Anaerolineae bacterium]
MTQHIVWLDKDHDFLAPLMRPLQFDGYRILPLRTVADALIHLSDLQTCNLVILDLLLPTGGAQLGGQDPYMGRALLRHLRTVYRFERPVIVCSVVTQPAVLVSLKELRVDRVLNKLEMTAGRLKQEADAVWDERARRK